MIVSANGTSADKKSIKKHFERFLEMMEEDEEIHFTVSVGQSDKQKFKVSNAINGIEELTETENELLEQHGLSRNVYDVQEGLETLSCMLDEGESA